MCHLIYMFFGSSVDKVNCAKFHHCRICVTDLKEGGLFGPLLPWAVPKNPILNKVRLTYLILFM